MTDKPKATAKEKAAKAIEEAALAMAQAKARLKDIEAKERREAAESKRKLEDRQKMLLGAFLLDQMTKNGIGAAMVSYEGKRLDDWLVRPAERELFGLVSR